MAAECSTPRAARQLLHDPHGAPPRHYAPLTDPTNNLLSWVVRASKQRRCESGNERRITVRPQDGVFPMTYGPSGVFHGVLGGALNSSQRLSASATTEWATPAGWSSVAPGRRLASCPSS